MSSHHKKYRPYIRRMKPSDKSDDFWTAIRLELYRSADWSGWVLVQHGFPGVVMAVDRCKRDLMHSPFPVLAGSKTFKQWARDFQRHAAGGAA